MAEGGASDKRTYGLLFIMVSIWAVNFSVVKWGLLEMSTAVFNAIRFALAAGLIVVLACAKEGWKRVSGRDWFKIVGLGLLGNSLYQLLFMEGLARTTAGNASVLLSTSPIWTALLSVGLGREVLSAPAWLGIVVATAGVTAVTAGQGGGVTLGHPVFLGNLLVILSALSWSLYSVLSLNMLRRYSPLRLTALTMVTGSVVLWVVGVPSAITQDWAVVSWRGWGAIIYASVFSVVVAYVIWTTGVRRIGPARTAAFGNLCPVMAFVAAYVLLGESVSWLQGVGACLILVGVSLTTRRARQRSSGAPRPAC